MIYMLESMHYIVAGVENASQACDILESASVSALIVSLELQDLDGVKIARKAKEHQRDLKVIVASGDLHSRRLDSSIDAFIRKPFSIHEICRSLELVSA